MRQPAGQSGMFPRMISPARIILLLLLLPPAASADPPLYYQVPGSPIWVDVPTPWTVRPDPKAPRLLIQNKDLGRLEVTVMKDTPMNDAQKRVRAVIEARHQDVAWTRGKIAGETTGKGTLRGRDIHLRVRLVPEKTSTIAVVSFTAEAGAKAVHALQDAVLKSIEHGWQRPGGVWARIPDASARVNVRTGWKTLANPDPHQLHINSRDGQGAIQLMVDQREDKTLDDSLDMVVELAGGAAVTWSEPTAWKPTDGARAGLRRTGTATADGHTLRFAVYVVPIREGRLMLAARTTGDAAAPLMAQVEEIAASLR